MSCARGLSLLGRALHHLVLLLHARDCLLSLGQRRLGLLGRALRLDKQQSQTFNMGKSTDGEALFFPGVVAIVRAMLAAERMAFEFTPFSADPAEMRFDLRGIGEAVTPVRTACPQTP